MDNKDFDNKENLGHGIKGDISTADTNLRNEKDGAANNVHGRTGEARVEPKK